MNSFELLKNDAFESFSSLAHEAGFDKVYDGWCFEGTCYSEGYDGWSTEHKFIDGIPVKFFMFREDSIITGSFKPSIIVDVDDMVDMYPNKIGWGRENEIDANDFGADLAWDVDLHFSNDVNHTSVEEINDLISKVVERAIALLKSYKLI